uniref:Uncharacterized protein n=1 Tax=Anguilla anguilla TaxID=7936 RepID=A0A0E9UNA4_ANGAN
MGTGLLCRRLQVQFQGRALPFSLEHSNYVNCIAIWPNVQA